MIFVDNSEDPECRIRNIFTGAGKFKPDPALLKIFCSCYQLTIKQIFNFFYYFLKQLPIGL
jgi:hypothetical protein